MDELIDKAHFALLVNCAVLVVLGVISGVTFDVLDPDHRPSSKTFIIGMIVVSLLVWVLIFGSWGWTALRGRSRAAVGDESSEQWDRWLDGSV